MVGKEEVWLGVVVIAGVVVGLTVTSFWAEFTDTIVYFAILCMGLNIVMGFAGQLDFGHAAFFAIGAYAAAKLMTAHPGADFVLVLIVGAAVAGVAALLLGFPVFRVQGDFVALITVALAEIVYALATNINWIGASNGINSIPVPHILGVKLGNYYDLLWLGLVLFGLTAAFTLGLSKVRFGRALVALREDELAARCSGIRTLRYKIGAYAIAGALAGIAGAYFAGLLSFVGPDSFNINQSFVLGEAVILGGLGSVLGSVIGAGVLVGIETLLVDYVPQVSGHEDLILGIIVLVIILVRPQGILGRPFLRRRT
jgi:branched-chain amino acid transport system permease protein